jgi:hypothetical protein
MKSSTTLKVIPNPTDDPTGKCDDGYYLSANSKECTVCPENAVCSNSKMNCIDGYENINEKCEKQSAQSASLNVGLISGAAAGGVLLAVIVVAGFLSIGRSRRRHRANSANPLTVASKYQTSNTAIFTPPSRFDPGDNSGEAVYSSVESLGQQFIPETHASNDFSGVRTINNRSLPLLPPGY